MSNLKDELARWRDVSGRLDGLQPAKKADESAPACPLCGKTGVLVETMMIVNGSDEGVRTGLFTCRFCNESWSEPIR